MPPVRFAPPTEVPGLAARRIAADILDGVLHKRRTLDDQLDGAAAHPGLKTLSDRDRALMRRLVATILRRLGTLGHVLSRLLDRGIPTDAPRAQSALLIGAAQILWMDVPDHAAVDLSVRLVQSDRRAAKYAGLVNAVLRRCAREGQPLIDEVKAQTLDVPPWLMARWTAHYGEATAKEIAIALSHEPSLDLTVKSDAAQWATRLHGEDAADRNRAHAAAGRGDHAAGLCRRAMVGAGRRRGVAGAVVRRRHGQSNRGSVRGAGRQDRAAGAGRRKGHRDRPFAQSRGAAARQFCAARAGGRGWSWRTRPNGKASNQFDGVLVDAPCASTGTIRRHPDVAWLRQELDIGALMALQKRLLQKAVALLKPGGTLVYCTCSLEPEEGEQAVAALLAAEPGMRRVPDRGRRGGRIGRNPDPRRRPAHPALPPAACRPPPERARRFLCGAAG